MSNKECFGRVEEKELFKHFISGNEKQILIFQGQIGIGKTTLLKALYDIAEENRYICAYFKCVGSIDEETRILEKLRRELDKDAREDIKSYSGDFFTLFDDILRKIENRESRKNSDNLYNKLWKSFRHAIGGISEQIGDSRVILFFDETERLSPNIKEWLRHCIEECVKDDQENIKKLLFVFATINNPTKRIVWKEQGAIVESNILEFSEKERRKYLQNNLPEEKRKKNIIKSISSVTGNPFALSLFCKIQKSEEVKEVIKRINSENNSSDIFLFNIINELLQKKIDDYSCKKIAKRSSVLRSFDNYVLDMLKEECSRQQCEKLKKCSQEKYLDKLKHPLVVERIRILVYENISYDIYKYHDQFCSFLYNEAQDDPRINHKKLRQVFLNYYKERYKETNKQVPASSTDDKEKLFLSDKSDLFLLEAIYHQLKINEKKGLEFARDEFKLARQSFNLSRCTRIISELEQFSSRNHFFDQMVHFLLGKMAMTKGYYGNGIEKFKQVLEKPDLLIGKDEFEFEVRIAYGESFFLQGNHPDSLKELRKALKKVEGREEKFPKIAADAHWIIGRIYRSQGNMQSAAEHLRSCIKLSIQTKRNYFAGYGLCTLGEVYQMQGEYERAEVALEDSLDKLGEERSQEILGRSLHVLGRVYQFQGKWQKAEPHLKRSLEIRQELTKDKPQHSLGYAYWGFGWFYLFQRNASAALDNLEKSENIFKTLNEKDGIARTYRLQAEVCLMQGDNEQAAELLHKAIAIQKEKKGNYELGLLHLGLTRYHIAMENWQKAVETNEKARMLCEGSGDRWAQVKSDILQCQIDMHLSQYDDLESRLSKANIEAENFPDLMFELELVRGEYAVTTDRLNDGVGAYKKAYSKAKEFYHPDEGNANYVAKAIYGQVQSLPQEKKEYLTNALPEIMSVAAE
ncbi:MAG: hypothetical protein D3911_09420 [Candidatus Electrothrix sp. AW3_4]|nr:hypothetical protein [Candidatus Electrothrix gigas]